MISFCSPPDIDTRGWPLVTNYSHPLYFSPESGGLYASPMDEGPSEPCDAQPDDLGIAHAIERLRQQAPRLVPRTLRHSWAGLRTFAPDHGLVVGQDPLVRGFFWLAGQGGCGIATSPAVGRIAADLIIDGHSEQPEARFLDPARFRSGGNAGRRAGPLDSRAGFRLEWPGSSTQQSRSRVPEPDALGEFGSLEGGS